MRRKSVTMKNLREEVKLWFPTKCIDMEEVYSSLIKVHYNNICLANYEFQTNGSTQVITLGVFNYKLNECYQVVAIYDNYKLDCIQSFECSKTEMMEKSCY